jgi:hypothetical protein
VLAVLLLAVGCADKLELKGDDPDASSAADAGEPEPELPLPRGIPARSGSFKNSATSADSIITVADATSDTEWCQFDLDSGREASDEQQWDLAFSRFRIRLNGGLSGPAGVQVAALVDQSFAELTRAPDEGYSPEQPDSTGEEGDADNEPDNPFNAGAEDWYDYDVMTHELSAKPITYVVLSSEARYYKLRIESYYDKSGTPGAMKFEWAELEGPVNGN